MRRSWRIMSALALVLAAGSILLSAYLFAQIQSERLSACEQQNQRHDHTIRILDREIAKLPAGPRRRKALEGRAGTIHLIDALSPKRACRELVKSPAPAKH